MKRAVLVFVLGIAFLGIAALVWHTTNQERNAQNPLLTAYNKMVLGTEKAKVVVIVRQHLADDDPIVLFGQDTEIWDWLWMDKKLPGEALAETATLNLHFSKDKLIKAIYKHNRGNALKTRVLE